MAVDPVLAGIIDAARQETDFAFDRFDGPARHRLGNRLTNFRKFTAEGRDRLIEMVGPSQGFDLARDLDQMPFQRREIGSCGRRRGCIGRRGRSNWRRWAPSWGGRYVIELALAR